MKKILLVDDNTINLHLLATYLTAANYSYATAENGAEAWKILHKNPEEFGLVIADRVMPKLHGLELLAKMRADPLLEKIPFILMTGLADKAEVIEATEAGVADFLYKPLEQELLLAVLKRIFLQEI